MLPLLRRLSPKLMGKYGFNLFLTLLLVLPLFGATLLFPIIYLPLPYKVSASLTRTSPSSEQATTDTRFFSKEITLSRESEPAGAQFPARIAYRAFGSPSNPAVVLPTAFAGSLEGTTPFLYTEKDGNSPVFSLNKFFIVVIGQMGGGESASPSNTPAPWNGPNFPNLTYEDNIRLQYDFLTKDLGVDKFFAYIGFSMGGQQAYHMASLFPDFVQNIVCIAGSAKTSRHNWSFLEGPRLALTTASDFYDGNYTRQPMKGCKAFSRVWSTWALSHEWFRQRSWEQIGYKNLEEYLDVAWSYLIDANDSLKLLWMWQHGDITVYQPEDKGDLAKALGRISARVLLMPSRTDSYFTPEDSEEEVKHIEKGELKVIESIWGHLAGGGGGTEEDTEFIKESVKVFLGIE